MLAQISTVLFISSSMFYQIFFGFIMFFAQMYPLFSTFLVSGISEIVCLLDHGCNYMELLFHHLHLLIVYTLSHLENDRDVSAYSGGRRLSTRAQLLCFLTRSKRNTGIDA